MFSIISWCCKSTQPLFLPLIHDPNSLWKLENIPQMTCPPTARFSSCVLFREKKKSIRWIPCEFAHFYTSPLRFPSNFIGIIFGMFLDYTNHFWPQLTTFDPLNWHFKIFCNFKGYKFANFKEVQRPSYKSYWPNFFLTMSKKVQFAKKNRKKKKKYISYGHTAKNSKMAEAKKNRTLPPSIFD